MFALLFIIVYLFILTFSHTQRDFCFYCLQLNLAVGTNELALVKGGGGGYHFHWKRRIAKVGGGWNKKGGVKIYYQLWVDGSYMGLLVTYEFVI